MSPLATQSTALSLPAAALAADSRGSAQQSGTWRHLMSRLLTRLHPKSPHLIRRVVYISRARVLRDADTLRRECRQFSVTNTLLNVTGLLIHSGPYYLQILEAEPAVMDDLLRRIAKDYRHTHFKVMVDECVGHRMFERCRMGLLDLGEHYALRLPDLEDVRGVLTRIFSDPLSAAEGMRQLMGWIPHLMKKTIALPA